MPIVPAPLASTTAAPHSSHPCGKHTYTNIQHTHTHSLSQQIHPRGSAATRQDLERLFCDDPGARRRRIRFGGGKGVYADMYRAELAKARADGMGGQGQGGGQMGAAGGGDDGVVLVDDKRAALVGAGGGQGLQQQQQTQQQPVPIHQLPAGAGRVAAIFERATVVSFDLVLDLCLPASASTPSNPTAAAAAAATAGGGGGGDDPIQPILELVRNHAVLVRGNWVRRSSLCGLPPRLALARDALLLLLDRYGGLNRLQVAAAAGLEEAEVLALLRPFAHLDAERRMWVLTCPDDVGFLERYPEVAAQQWSAWREKERGELAPLLAAVGPADCLCPGPVPAAAAASTVTEAMDVMAAGGGGGGGAAAASAKPATTGRGRRKG